MNEQIKAAILNQLDYCEIIEGNGVEVVEVEDWIDEGKYSYQNTIVKYQDKFYNVSQSRSGSYFTDYFYNDPVVTEVKPVEKTITIWVRA